MSDGIVSRLKSPEVFISIGGMVSPVAHEAADLIEAQAAEITRLRAALATAQVIAFKKAAEIARQFAQNEGWSGSSALRLRNCIIAETIVYTKTGGKDE